ncbi:hypothetical protein DTL21_24380 [Bremerella cremea]|uniref:Uncharacterized protein n=1 Tax=Blastopirellula marina TaxID=124 RepID=A0A2S8FEH4_9BACT|nr:MULTISPECIES: hypothetical protein [Pirellulaceae]PQO30490.1 hypothetical protein C5Y83_24335 [Blastopirellula marina]RCS43843.1 hypothetical protein DTL21_24380 [Bremerella cremea]
MKIGNLFTKSILATLLFCSVSQAGWNEFWDRVHIDYARNKCWPSPFVEQDRASVRNYFATMTASGIRLQNTLGDHFFEPANNDIVLTPAGKLKVRQILMSAEDRRMIFVMRGLTEEETNVRIAAVQTAMQELVGNADATEVLVSPNQPIGRSADYIDDVYRRERATIPAPRLPSNADG